LTWVRVLREYVTVVVVVEIALWYSDWLVLISSGKPSVGGVRADEGGARVPASDGGA
jgi:hypothetical protein